MHKWGDSGSSPYLKLSHLTPSPILTLIYKVYNPETHFSMEHLKPKNRDLEIRYVTNHICVYNKYLEVNIIFTFVLILTAWVHPVPSMV